MNSSTEAEKVIEPGSADITLLADFGDDVLLDEAGMAKAFHVVPRTIRRMVARYELPPPCRLASKNRWKVGNVRIWLHDRIQAGEREAKRVASKIAGF